MSDLTPTSAPPPEEPLDDGEELLGELGQHWTTLAELGQTLPLALGPNRSFEWQPMTLDLRQKVAAHCASLRNRETQAGLVCYAIGLALASLQGDSLEGQRPEAIAARLRLLPWTSVLYLLLHLSMTQSGRDEVDLPDLRCPTCGTLHRRARGRIGAMRVRAYGELTVLPRIDVQLTDGLPYPPGQRAKWVTLQPARWDFLVGVPDGQIENRAAVTRATLASGICGLDTVPGEFAPTAALLGQLSARDADLLDGEMSLLSGGPTMALPVTCSGHDFAVPFAWRSLDFFGGSSRQRKDCRRPSQRR